jgi:hypothetical protein
MFFNELVFLNWTLFYCKPSIAFHEFICVKLAHQQTKNLSHFTWTIVHFDGYWVVLKANCVNNFDVFWVISGHFIYTIAHAFQNIASITNAFSVLVQFHTFWNFFHFIKTCIFGQKAWTIAYRYGFDRFWFNFTPFESFDRFWFNFTPFEKKLT